jgi:hypothetical protein
VPAGIANTAFELLQRGKKTSVFGWSSTFACAATPHVAFRRARAVYAARSSAPSRNATEKFFRLVEYIENIRVFDASDFSSHDAHDAHAQHKRDQKTRRDEALSIPSGLCKKFRSRGL